MTISAVYSPDNYAGDDSTTTFAITFAFLSVSTNVKVSIKVDSTGVITTQVAATDYNITGSNVVFTAGSIPATGETVIIELNPDFKQTSDYRENDVFPAETLEADLDERTLEGQINNDLVTRGFKLDSSVSLSGKTLAVDLPSSGTEFLTLTSTGLGTSTTASSGALTLPVDVSNGGTGTTTHTADAILTGNGTSAITSEANITAPSGILTVGNGATSAGKIDFLEDSDNGTNKVSLKGPDSTADVTVTLPAATDTLVGKATTDTLTNKTIDADGTGNVITNIGSSEIKSEIITGQTEVVVSASDVIMFADADDSNNLKKDTVQGLLDLVSGAPEGYISGLELRNDTDTSHDIEIGVGTCRDSANGTNLALTSVLTKQIDAIFAAGDDAGGLFTGAVAADTWYHVFVIKKDSDGTIDGGFDTSVSAANIPAGYTEYRRVGSVLTNSSSNIIAFYQSGDEFVWADPPRDVALTGQTHTTRSAVTASVPPDVEVLIHVNKSYASSGVTLSSPHQNQEAGGISTTPTVPQDSFAAGSGNKFILTDTSQQYYHITDGTTSNIYLFTLGYRDKRGK